MQAAQAHELLFQKLTVSPRCLASCSRQISLMNSWAKMTGWLKHFELDLTQRCQFDCPDPKNNEAISGFGPDQGVTIRGDKLAGTS